MPPRKSRAKKKKTPPHYRSLTLRNFRGFKKEDKIPLRPLTFLVGPNSAGKSSLFDALLVLAQSDFGNPLGTTGRPVWSGPLVDLGSYKDAVYWHNVSFGMMIGVEYHPGSIRLFPAEPTEFGPIALEYRMRHHKANPEGMLTSIDIRDIESGERFGVGWSGARARRVVLSIRGSKHTLGEEEVGSLFWRTQDWAASLLHPTSAQAARTVKNKTAWRRLARFVSAPDLHFFTKCTDRVASGRSGPQRSYPFPSSVDDRTSAKVSGLFDRVDPGLVEEMQRNGGGKKARSKGLAEVLKDLDIARDISQTQISPYHSAILLTDSQSHVKSHLIDVGYGTSQVLPVVAACLNGRPGPLLVEQPEIHLHPKAQGVIAELLCRTSMQRQVIVETHAVHMINRARIMIAKGELNADDVIVNFVSRDRTGSHIHTIPLLPNGDFGAEWPDGFFDERYQDTMNLMRLKAD